MSDVIRHTHISLAQVCKYFIKTAQPCDLCIINYVINNDKYKCVMVANICFVTRMRIPMSDFWSGYMAALPSLVLRPILPCKIGMIDFPENGFKKANVWLYSEEDI